MLGLKEEISLRIWLSAIAKSGRNGTANIMYKDLMIENRVTRAQINNFFNPKEAEKLEIIKVLINTENFISINFKKGAKQVAGPVQVKLAQKSLLEDAEPVNLPAVVQAKTPAIKGFLTEIPKIYTPTNDLIRAIIKDYTLFYKQLQVDKAAFIGNSIQIEDSASPAISGEDVKHFRELSKHFAKQPGILNEDQIKRCFHRVYVNWWNFTDYVKTRPEPRYIRSNINTIITEIQALNQNNGKTTDKRENEVNSKINRAKSKDYSHLGNSRKKDN
jgi:hypothetical protein